MCSVKTKIFLFFFYAQCISIYVPFSMNTFKWLNYWEKNLNFVYQNKSVNYPRPGLIRTLLCIHFRLWNLKAKNFVKLGKIHLKHFHPLLINRNWWYSYLFVGGNMTLYTPHRTRYFIFRAAQDFFNIMYILCKVYNRLNSYSINFSNLRQFFRLTPYNNVKFHPYLSTA